MQFGSFWQGNRKRGLVEAVSVNLNHTVCGFVFPSNLLILSVKLGMCWKTVKFCFGHYKWECINRDSVCYTNNYANNCKNYHKPCTKESKPQNSSAFAMYVSPHVYISTHINVHIGINVSNCEERGMLYQSDKPPLLKVLKNYLNKPVVHLDLKW